MRYSNWQNGALISSLLATVAVTACSSGSDTPTKPTTTTTAGSGGAGGTGSTTTTTGSAGSSTTTVGTGGAGTGGAGTGGTGTGGAGGSGGSGAPSVCDGKATRPLAIGEGRVDDFEDAALSPGWSTFNDVMPTPNSFKMTQEAGGAVTTAHFGHYAGMGAKTPVMGGYGVGTIYNMAIDKVAGIYCVDISGYDGLTFWAKAAKTGSKVGVNFVVPETNALADGGDCMTGCYLHPSKTITLTADWAQYSVTFLEATGGTAKVKNRLQLLGWLSPDAAWDFSLDEIQLYKGTPPTGPVRSADGGP